jgi:hypothetical protein
VLASSTPAQALPSSVPEQQSTVLRTNAMNTAQRIDAANGLIHELMGSADQHDQRLALELDRWTLIQLDRRLREQRKQLSTAR